MTNKERLQKNNLNLTECLSLAANLPEGASGKPIEVDTLDNSLLTAENDGKVYKCDDKLYQVNKVKSLKGLTIKFNEHITPCPVIGEDDVFECSGEYTLNLHMPPPTAISTVRRKLYSDSSITANISFTVDTETIGRLEFFNVSDPSVGSVWYLYDENGNVYETEYGERAITNFDCPALNENPEFIEWTFANAKVYSKIEDLSDIKAFKYTFQPIWDYYFSLSELISALVNATLDRESGAQDDNISGLFTISFSINGELVTKTFNRCDADVQSYKRYTFSNSNNNDILSLEGNDIDGTTTIKYNDITLDDSVLTFTKFECECNNPYMFIVHILRFAELIDMEYINGCEWVEYVIAEAEESGNAEFNIAYGDTEPTDTSKLWVKTAEPSAVSVTANATFGTITGVELPTVIQSMGAASVGTKVYLFGGFYSNSMGTMSFDTINVFDTESGTITTLDTALPTPIERLSAATVGTKVYLFGGESEGYPQYGIYVFDTESNTITFLDTLPETDYLPRTAVVGTKVYLFGCGENQNAIRVFDSQTKTINTLSATPPTSVMNTQTAVVGTKVYLLGGDYGNAPYGSILEFDTERNTTTILDTLLPDENLHGFGTAVFGKKIYLFGGMSEWTTNDIWVFDTETNTFIEADKKLAIETQEFGISTVGTKAYLFGGYRCTAAAPFSHNLSCINVFTAELPLAENNLLIDAGASKNLFNLLPNVKTGVNAVYLGNEIGVGEKVSAALYNDGAWVEI